MKLSQKFEKSWISDISFSKENMHLNRNTNVPTAQELLDKYTADKKNALQKTAELQTFVLQSR